jgi:anti-sigma B factor antagonist
MGLATMTNSSRLQEALEDLRTQGFHRFVFDLEECTGFDSTFMGILLGVALGEARGPAGAAVMVVNSADSHLKLLSGVGIDRMVTVHVDPIEFPPVDLQRLDDRPVDALRRIRTMVAAHENLVRLGGPNVDKFGFLLDTLKQELGGPSGD